jgi:hypothetical protein
MTFSVTSAENRVSGHGRRSEFRLCEAVGSRGENMSSDSHRSNGASQYEDFLSDYLFTRPTE